MMLTQRYGSRETFLATYNPDYQRQICADTDKCFFGDFPTFGAIREAYGSNMATAWLIPQLYNLSEYCGCKEKLQGRPLEECASVISTEFHYLKISEVMLFFHRFKSGRYGRFYGSVDPLVITTSLREFLKERTYAYDKHEQELKEREYEEMRKNSVTWEQYCEMYGIKDWAHPLDRKNDDKPDCKHPRENDEGVLETAKSILDGEFGNGDTKQQFIKIFKRKYGCAPKEYIDKHNENI